MLQAVLNRQPATLGKEAGHLGGKEGGCAQHWGRGAAGDDLSLTHECHAVSRRRSELHVVSDEQDASAINIVIFLNKTTKETDDV